MIRSAATRPTRFGDLSSIRLRCAGAVAANPSTREFANFKIMYSSHVAAASRYQDPWIPS